MVASARSVSRGSIKQWPCCVLYLGQDPNIQSENTRLEILCFTPLTGISSDTAVRSLLLYCFSGLSALLLLTYTVACKSEVVMNWTVWSVIHILGLITPNFLYICVMIIAALAIFQALISMGLSIGKCLTSIAIRHMVRLFEFYCECTAIKRNFKFWFVWLFFSPFLSFFLSFFFLSFFASNPFTEFCCIHLIFTSVGRHHEVCQKLL